MRSHNPVLTPAAFERQTATQSRPMTIQGTVNASIMLLGLMMFSALYTWNKAAVDPSGAMPWMWGGAIGGLVLALVTAFKAPWAPVTGPLYALAEGLFVGAISAMYEAQFQGIVLQAVLLTSGTMLAMLAGYSMRIIRVTEKFRAGLLIATGGIFLVYALTWILRLFGVEIGFIHSSGALGIGFSVVVVAIAAMNLLLDFDFIEQGAKAGAPKYMEWYGAFGLLVTLVWLYIEILRLLSKLNRRD